MAEASSPLGAHGSRRASSEDCVRNKEVLQVAIRLKPVSDREKVVWTAKLNCVRSSVNGGSQYIFDKVYGPEANNANVFEDSVKNIVEYAINGYNGTVFAYGQTASGKTHTMKGTSDSWGVIPQAIKHVVNYIENTPNRTYLIRVSYMEIYNDCIRDLLDDSPKDLKVHDSKDGNPVVSGLKETVVNSEADLINCFWEGEERRSVGATAMNEKSSRSHAIFKMVIESQETDMLTQGFNEAIVISHLNFVDLAGSEKVGQMVSNNKMARFKEGCNINLSLLALSQVISRLSEGKPKQFINYRDSNLTRILKCSLGGNAQTAVICTVTPSDYEETLSTLKFAERAKIVKNKPRINEIHSKDSMLKYYEKVIDQLQADLQCEKVSKLPQELMQKELEMKDTRITQLEEKLSVFQQKLFVSSQSISFASPAVKGKSFVNRRETWCVPTTFRKSRIPILHLTHPDSSSCGLIPESPDENITMDTEEVFVTTAPAESSKLQTDSFQVDVSLPSSVYSQQTMPAKVVIDSEMTSDEHKLTKSPEELVEQEGCCSLEPHELKIKKSDGNMLAENIKADLNKLKTENEELHKACEQQRDESVKLMESLARELQKYECFICKLQFENDALRKTSAQQVEEIVALSSSRQALENVECSLNRLNVENDALRKTLEQQLEEIMKLKSAKEELEKCKNLIGNLTSENDALRISSEQQLEEIRRLAAAKEELEQCERRIGELTVENNALRRTSEHQLEEVAKLKASNQELENIETSLGKLAFEKDELQRTLEQEVAKLKEELKKYENRVVELMLENNELQRMSKQQMEDVTKLQAKKQKLENTEAALGKLTVEKDELQRTFEQEITELKEELKKHESRVDELMIENDKLQRMSKQQMEDVTRKIKAEKQKLEDSHSLKLKELQESYSRKQTELKTSFKLEEELAIERAVLSATEEAMELLEMERQNHDKTRNRERENKREVKILQQKLTEIESSIQKNGTDGTRLAENASERLNAAAAQIEELKKERGALSEDFFNLRNKQLKTDNHIKELNSELFTKDCEINKLQMYIKMEEAPYKDKAQRLEKECKKLTEKNEQLQRDLRRLGTGQHNSTVLEYKVAKPLHPATGMENAVPAASGLGMIDSFKLEYVQAENHALKNEMKKLKVLLKTRK